MKLPVPYLIIFLFLASPELHAQQLSVDHFWIRVSAGAPEALVLTAAGLQFQEFPSDSASPQPSSSQPNYTYRHTGQGTANNIVRFRNMYLELIWVDDANKLASAAPQLGYTLLHSSNTSPIGIGLRHSGSDSSEVPFATEAYHADWMLDDESIAVARRVPGSDADPAVFVVPNYMRWDTRVLSNPSLLSAAEHELGLETVTRLKVSGPGLPSTSESLAVLQHQGLVEFESADEHLLEVWFDGGDAEMEDFRPELPLVFYH